MRFEELITKVSRLPASRQQEVMDFVTFLEQNYAERCVDEHADWSGQQFREMSIAQAMRGLETEPDLYSQDDLEEHW